MSNIDKMFGNAVQEIKECRGIPVTYTINEKEYQAFSTLPNFAKAGDFFNRHCQIITHIDLDGYAAAAVIIDAIGEQYPGNSSIVVHHTDYDSYPTLDKTASVIYITDYAFQHKAMADDIIDCLKSGTPVIYIDHHESGIANLNAIIHEDEKKYELLKTLPGIRTSDYCGAYLAWAYFHPGDKIAPKFIDLVDQWDCWKNPADEPKHLVDAFNFIEDDIWPKDVHSQEWSRLIHGEQNALANGWQSPLLDRYLDYGRKSEMFIRDFRRRVCLDESFVAEINHSDPDVHLTAIVAVSQDHSSMVFGDLLTTNKQKGIFDYGLLIHDNGYRYSCFIYTKDTLSINARDIATMFHGGGHDGAAGFSYNKINDPNFLPYRIETVVPLKAWLHNHGYDGMI